MSNMRHPLEIDYEQGEFSDYGRRSAKLHSGGPILLWTSVWVIVAIQIIAGIVQINSTVDTPSFLIAKGLREFSSLGLVLCGLVFLRSYRAQFQVEKTINPGSTAREKKANEIHHTC